MKRHFLAGPTRLRAEAVVTLSWSRIFGVVLIATVCAVTVVPAALAHHTDNVFKTQTYQNNCSTTTLCQSDNSALTFFREASLDLTAKQNIYSVLYDKYNPTDLSVSQESPPVYTGGAETDLVYRVNGAIFPASGKALCDDPIDSTKCDQFYINFGNSFWSHNIVIACHETGHGVGFTHGQQAYPVKADNDNSLECMSNAGSAPYVVGPHMIPQINATY